MQENMKVASISHEICTAALGTPDKEGNICYSPKDVREFRFLLGVISQINPLDPLLAEKVSYIKEKQSEILKSQKRTDLNAIEKKSKVDNLFRDIKNHPRDQIVIPKEEYISFIKRTKKNTLNDTLVKLSEQMMKSTIDIAPSMGIHKGDGFRLMHVFEDISYCSKAGELTLYINNIFYPHIVDLEKYVKAQIKNIICFSTTRATRIYVLCQGHEYNLSNKKEHSFQVSLDDIHHMLCKDNTYSDFRYFKSTVLTPTVNTVNKTLRDNIKANYSISFAPIRASSRKVNFIEFTLTKTNLDQIDTDNTPSASHSSIDDDFIDNIVSDLKIDKKLVQDLISENGKDRVAEVYEHILTLDPSKIKKSRSGVFLSAIRDNYEIGKSKPLVTDEDKIKKNLLSQILELKVKRQPLYSYNEDNPLYLVYSNDIKEIDKQIEGLENQLQEPFKKKVKISE